MWLGKLVAAVGQAVHLQRRRQHLVVVHATVVTRAPHTPLLEEPLHQAIEARVLASVESSRPSWDIRHEL